MGSPWCLGSAWIGIDCMDPSSNQVASKCEKCIGELFQIIEACVEKNNLNSNEDKD